eukprot:TRINITY_DN122685_c0_g1_i1.p1 TRINITY_DN122685_c0_g1~~TRINITY_DN122685_c0_g1_i1.p1  ORF type:complete len:370 (+),score=22.28 TRINITY_DN122685_c0_g1_i1:91-1110(+)
MRRISQPHLWKKQALLSSESSYLARKRPLMSSPIAMSHIFLVQVLGPQIHLQCSTNSSQIRKEKSSVMSTSHSDQASLKDKFCKHYANIRLHCDAPFQERMQFDIYKRATKLERYEVFLDSQKPKMPKEELDKVFDRIQKDTAKRIEHKTKKVDESFNSNNNSRANERKVTQAETEKMYSNFMEKWKKTQERLEEKRRAKKLKEEMEEQQILAIQNQKSKRRKSVNYGVSLVDRMNADVERRKIKQEQRKNEQEQRAQDEMKGLFVPKTNKNYRSGIRSNRPKSRLNVSVNYNFSKPEAIPKRREIPVMRPVSVFNDESDTEETERFDNPGMICGKRHL